MGSLSLRAIRTFMVVIVAVLVAATLPLPQGSLAARQGTLELTLRGCPDGVDPTAINNPRRECDVPLDAPDDAFIYYGGDGQGGEEVKYLDRKYDGTYVASIPSNLTVDLIGFEPTVRDSYAMTGVSDRNNDGNFDVRVRAGRKARVRVYYYNDPSAGSGPGGSASATVNLTFRACPEGTDPNYVDPWDTCTIPLDAPDASMLYWDLDNRASIPGLPRQYDGTYVLNLPSGALRVELWGIAPVVRNAYVIYGHDLRLNDDGWGISLRPGEVREVWVFYYYW